MSKTIDGKEGSYDNKYAAFEAALNSLYDGVLIASNSGEIFHYNARFCQMWSIPEELMAAKDDYVLVSYVLPQLIDPDEFTSVIERLYQSPAASEDILKFKDGRVFERLSIPLLIDGEREGRVWFFRDITFKKSSEDALRLAQYCIEKASVGIWRIGDTGKIMNVNDHACRCLGYTREELLSKTIFDVDPTFPREKWAEHRRKVRAAGTRVIETTHQRKDGSCFPVEVVITFHEFEGEEFSLSFVQDISERKKAEDQKALLESQLLQAQKMEAIGRLAGGVAHDFNNMLTVILSYAELAKIKADGQSPILGYLSQIQKAAARSQEITRQLLGFSRKQIISPRVIDLNAVIEDLLKTLGRLIGEDITVSFYPEKFLGSIKFDPSQIEQILMNLVVNARDAMPDGGRIIIETKNVAVDDSYRFEKQYAIPGDYVMLSVSDDGTGMDPAIQGNIFEPFFTTKEPGRGTGLGLATVYGIVKQNEGFINFYSETGRGTTFRIYIPRCGEKALSLPKFETGEIKQGTSTILIVEDDEILRELIINMLTDSGYTVLAASSPKEALSLLEDPGQTFDLLLTDVIMPQMSGAALRDRILERWPKTKVLFMSGYTDNLIVHQGVLEEGVNFISKPFTLSELVKKVEEVIG